LLNAIFTAIFMEEVTLKLVQPYRSIHQKPLCIGQLAKKVQSAPRYKILKKVL